MSFLWGAATSSHQVEGHNELNDWWRWESQGHCEGGVRSGAATDHWNRFAEDLAHAREMGLTSYRFSVEWSRLEPTPGRWDDLSFARYAEILAECQRLGLEPMLTLHHFTSPTWFADRGGFTDDDAPERFERLAIEVAKRIGKNVRLWCTLNEPMVLAAGTYLARIMPPAEFSPSNAARATRNLLRAHVLAYDALHRELGPNIQVGIAHNMIDFMPERGWHPMERLLARVFDRFYNRAWLAAVTGGKQRFGVPFLVPTLPPVAEARGRVTADFIGVNYYTKAYVQWRPKAAAPERPDALPLGLAFARRHEPASDLEWAIHPTGLAKVLKLAASYGLPLYITENGIADREDKNRPQYLLSHLRETARAIERGIDIRGYYYWSLLDNFEWIKGFGPRFGLLYVDYETLARRPTGSSGLLRTLIRRHRELGSPVPSTPVLEEFGRKDHFLLS